MTLTRRCEGDTRQQEAGNLWVLGYQEINLVPERSKASGVIPQKRESRIQSSRDAIGCRREGEATNVWKGKVQKRPEKPNQIPLKAVRNQSGKAHTRNRWSQSS